jgi:hypothetical protein
MADYGFPDQPLPIDEVKRPDGSYFFERSKLESGQFKSAFQKQHVQPEADMSGRGADFVRRISSTDVESRYRFSGSDFSLNGTPLPVSDADAVRLGSSAHRGSHQAYTDVVELYRQAETFRAQQVETAKLNELLGQPNPPAEAAARIEARKFADNFMAMEWKGIENTLRLASQVDGIPELGNAHRPGLVMHSGDPFRMASGFPDAASYNADFFNQMSIDRIAGELSTAPGHIGETTAGI